MKRKRFFIITLTVCVLAAILGYFGYDYYKREYLKLQMAEIGELVWDVSNPANPSLTINASSRAFVQVERGQTEKELVLIIHNAVIKTKSPSGIFQSDLVQSFTAKPTLKPLTNSVMFTFQLKKQCGAIVSSNDKNVQIQFITPKNTNEIVSNKTIIIDPGHGGHDAGASITDNKTRAAVNEKDFNLTIGQKLAERFSTLGALVVMTRNDDTFIPIGHRSTIANFTKGNFFISVHANAGGKPNQNSGSAIFYDDKNPEGTRLAAVIQKEVQKSVNIPNLGIISDRKTRFGENGFSVIRNSFMPAVLLEAGYLDNDLDRDKLLNNDWQNQYADAVLSGVINYLK